MTSSKGDGLNAYRRGIGPEFGRVRDRICGLAQVPDLEGRVGGQLSWPLAGMAGQFWSPSGPGSASARHVRGRRVQPRAAPGPPL